MHVPLCYAAARTHRKRGVERERRLSDPDLALAVVLGAGADPVLLRVVRQRVLDHHGVPLDDDHLVSDVTRRGSVRDVAKFQNGTIILKP